MPCDHCDLPYEIDIAHGSDEDFCVCLDCPGCGQLLSPEQDDPAPCETCEQCPECCTCEPMIDDNVDHTAGLEPEHGGTL